MAAVNIDNLVLENLSLEELTRLKERIAQAEMVPTGTKAVALAAALKAVIQEIRAIDPEMLGEGFKEISPQAMPKEANVGKRYGLSETQIKNAKDKANKLVTSL